MHNWKPFKTKQYDTICERLDVSDEYKNEVLQKEVYELIDKALNDKKFVIIINLVKEFVKDVNSFKPFYLKYCNWNYKGFKDYENFVFDVVAAYVLNWDEFLTKMHEKGATPYLEYIKNKAGV